MAFSGTTHNRIHDFTDDEASSIDPSALRFDEEFDDISSSMETRLAKDGTNTATADIPMGGFTFTGLAAATTNGEPVRYDEYTTFTTTNATDSVLGVVELATTAEIDTGTDSDRAITPAGLVHLADGSSTQKVANTALSALDGTSSTGTTAAIINSSVCYEAAGSNTTATIMQGKINVAGDFTFKITNGCFYNSGGGTNLTVRVYCGATLVASDTTTANTPSVLLSASGTHTASAGDTWYCNCTGDNSIETSNNHLCCSISTDSGDDVVGRATDAAIV